jgi:hypothetical protein
VPRSPMVFHAESTLRDHCTLTIVEWAFCPCVLRPVSRLKSLQFLSAHQSPSCGRYRMFSATHEGARRFVWGEKLVRTRPPAVGARLLQSPPPTLIFT